MQINQSLEIHREPGRAPANNRAEVERKLDDRLIATLRTAWALAVERDLVEGIWSVKNA